MTNVAIYRKLPSGFASTMNKMLRGMLLSRPLQAIPYFADYLEAEVNRRTLCDLQLREPCPSDSAIPVDPWVKYMYVMAIEKATQAILREEKSLGYSASITSFDIDLATKKCPKGRMRKSKGSSWRMPHKLFRWKPVKNLVATCQKKFDRYGPIISPVTISSRALRRYISDEPIQVVDPSKGKRHNLSYWRQIFQDCTALTKRWKEKTVHPRQKICCEEKQMEPSAKGSDMEKAKYYIDPYEEPLERKKIRNDGELAKIIYRELDRFPPPTKKEEELQSGKSSKEVMLEKIPSDLHPVPEKTQAEVLEKAVQAGQDEHEADLWSECSVPDAIDDSDFSIPSSPMAAPLKIYVEPDLPAKMDHPDTQPDAMDMESEEPAGYGLSDVPVAPLDLEKEIPAELMDVDEVNDPFSEA